MKIQLKQKHIDKGLRNNCQRCPVALAVGEVLNWPVAVSATIARLMFKDIPSIVHLILLPPEVRNFIREFDTYGAVEPFEFELDFDPALLEPYRTPLEDPIVPKSWDDV